MKFFKYPLLLFLIAYFAAYFAWMHSGWFALLLFIFLGPIYLIWGIVLCIVTRHREKKFPKYVADKRIRPTFAVLLSLLVAQLIAVPTLSDYGANDGYWSIFTGANKAIEGSAAYNNAALFMYVTNIGILISLGVFTVLLFLDRKKLSSK